jgi:hypothetical protein
LVQAPIAVGVDGNDAIGAIRSINFLNNEELNSALYKQSLQQGPDADARRTIAGWLASNGETALANLIIQVMQSQSQPTEPVPPQPTPEPQPTGATTMDEPVVQEGISDLRKLAGLVKK